MLGYIRKKIHKFLDEHWLIPIAFKKSKDSEYLKQIIADFSK